MLYEVLAGTPEFLSVIAFLCLTRNMVMRELAPQFHIPWSIPMEAEDIPIVPTTSGTMYVLTYCIDYTVWCSEFQEHLEKSWKICGAVIYCAYDTT